MSKTVKIAPAKPVATTADSGRVKVGGGMIRFVASASAKSTKDMGRVKVGGGMVRF
jgi:hypothetical protein